jgi:hypothetical protein
VSEEDNRWEAFSDEEVKLVDAALTVLEREEDLIGELREFPLEVERENDRREEAKNAATYRGPGYYTDVASGTTMHVVGQATIDHVRCLLVGSSLEDPHLWALPAHKIEGRNEYGNRRYEYSAVQP